MALIEQFCQRHIRSLQSHLPNFNEWQHRAESQMLQYIGGTEGLSQPTSSATTLLFKAIAASGASAYRNYEPALRDWKSNVSLDPANLRRHARDLYGKAGQEARLHQEIFARVIRTN